MNGYVTCNNCGWVHFSVNQKYIEQWKTRWANFWPTLDEEGREAYGLPNGPPSDRLYYHCDVCDGSYQDFHDYDPNKDVNINGHTIGPILERESREKAKA